jgi:transcriptional regulator with PAS, ATPase and Fis domain
MDAAASSPMKVEELTSLNPSMQLCLRRARVAARSDVPILLLGETGTGKTLLAQAIHNSSRRAGGPFISFNAAAMTDTLLESQLFGHEKGAFTGADHPLRGKFELADGGTLFFDEMADMSPLAQAKILRAIECGEFERLGSERVRHANVRIVSATNVSLRERIRRGLFREDLYQRLNGFTLFVPPLRERPQDLPGLIAWEVKTSAARLGKVVSAIDPLALERLMTYPWPGNLRELDHVIQTSVLLAESDTIKAADIQLDSDAGTTMATPVIQGTSQAIRDDHDLSLSTAIESHIHRVYELAGRNQHRAARLLGISRSTLLRHLRKPVQKCA